MDVSISELKNKLRNLKKLEIKIRFGSSKAPNENKLIWDEFFTTNDKQKSKYNINELILFSKEEFKEIIGEYFYNVYYRYYKENGIYNFNIYDPTLLAYMGLTPLSDRNDIKKRFRELAHKYHPDKGGDHNKFIELMDNYKKLMD